MSDLVTAAPIARLYGVGPDTVTGWAKEGKIPTAVITPGGHRRYRISDVLAACPIEGVTAESVLAAERAEATP